MGRSADGGRGRILQGFGEKATIPCDNQKALLALRLLPPDLAPPREAARRSGRDGPFNGNCEARRSCPSSSS
jgi:hypothetical protein